jgi:hypothetical protein
MALRAGCLSCAAPVVEDAGKWSCPDHGTVEPLWRPEEATYDDFAAHLVKAGPFPTFLPWPLGPGWSVSDFAVIADGRTWATMSCVSGTTALDGPVDVMVISEEPGTGLGARVAGLAASRSDAPGIGDGPPAIKVRLESFAVGLWPVSVSASEGEWDRSVLVGEAQGRWLWLVLRPASALLLLRDEWILRDVSSSGPQLVALPFGGPAPPW